MGGAPSTPPQCSHTQPGVRERSCPHFTDEKQSLGDDAEVSNDEVEKRFKNQLLAEANTATLLEAIFLQLKNK